jgi:hypothetical protein
MVTVTECTGPSTLGGVSVGIARCAMTNRFFSGKCDGEQAKNLLFELARVFVRFDHVASTVVNANHDIMNG